MRATPATIEVDPLVQQAANAPAFDARAFRDAMGLFATGVVVVSTEFEGNTHAMTANAFMSGSLEPPLVLVSIACTARMHDRIRQARGFGISVLGHEQLSISNHFAGKPAERAPRFETLDGMVVIRDAAVQVVSELQHEYACGDHTLFVGKVNALRAHAAPGAPLLFHRGRYAQLAPPTPADPFDPEGFWRNHELWW